ncbi:MAG: Ig-like domain-containing protein [Deltaproteobacteria bacterium]|nr:Ig-like domain-containing protein [Deltaproteobacteria bacterium]
MSVGFASVLFAAESGQASAPASVLSSITLKPDAPDKLFLGETLQFTATGIYADGSTANLSSKVKWAVSDTAVAAISESGLVSPVSPKNTHGSAMTDSAGVKVEITAGMDGVESPPVALAVINAGGPSLYYQVGGASGNSRQTIIASGTNQSGVKVTDGGVFSLADSMIYTNGNSNATGLSSAVGVNAGVLAENGAKIKIDNCMITTTGSGANGAFAHGEGSLVELYNVKIRCLGGAAHGVDTTYLGEVIIEDADIYTAGQSGGAALSNDTGDGSVYATRVKTYTEGRASPGFYAIGTKSIFKITDSFLYAKTGEGGLMTTGAIVTLTSSVVTGYTAGLSCSGGTMTVTGGEIKGANGPGIMVIAGPGRGRMGGGAAGGQGGAPGGGQMGGMPGGGAPGGQTGGMPDGGAPDGQMSGMPGGAAPGGQGGAQMGGMPEGAGAPGGMAGGFQMASISSDIIVKGGARITGSNGEIINVSEESAGNFTVEGEDLVGDMVVEEGSTLNVTLRDTNLTGRIEGAALTLESGSAWDVTGDSTLTSLSNKEGISGSSVKNIIGNGHTVYYDKDAAKELKGRTYSLAKGGKLTPRK